MVLDVPPQVRTQNRYFFVCVCVRVKPADWVKHTVARLHAIVCRQYCAGCVRFVAVKLMGHLFAFVFDFGALLPGRAEKVSGRQFGRMEQRTSAWTAHGARVRAGLRHGQSGDVSGERQVVFGL